jgi:hypothetical protein
VSVLAAGLIVAPSALAQGEPRQTPPALAGGGAWYSSPDCPDDKAARLAFLDNAAQVHGTAGSTSCTHAGLRQITPWRWYVDLECRNGRRIELDINALADGRLLVAHRPLGEACFYARSER